MGFFLTKKGHQFDGPFERMFSQIIITQLYMNTSSLRPSCGMIIFEVNDSSKRLSSHHQISVSRAISPTKKCPSASFGIYFSIKLTGTCLVEITRHQCFKTATEIFSGMLFCKSRRRFYNFWMLKIYSQNYHPKVSCILIEHMIVYLHSQPWKLYSSTGENF